jgi:hypothetical protein
LLPLVPDIDETLLAPETPLLQELPLKPLTPDEPDVEL